MIRNKYIILLLSLIIFILLISNLMEQRQYAMKELKTIEMEMQNIYNYYKRNEKKINEDNFTEIRQALYHLDAAINYQVKVDKKLIKSNTVNAINEIDLTFMKVASSHTVSEKNIEEFFHKILEVMSIIRNSTESARYSDITIAAYKEILNVLDELERLLGL